MALLLWVSGFKSISSPKRSDFPLPMAADEKSVSALAPLLKLLNR
jgi:hypothetical protein